MADSTVARLQTAAIRFDVSTSSGKLMRTIMAGLAEFERDLICERVKSGLAAAKARGVIISLGRQHGQRPSDKKAKKVLSLHAEGLSYRRIARNLGLSKNTVMEIREAGGRDGLGARLLDADESARKGSGGGEMGG
jgi:DNA invertase Pin-like site-specific DNA recombinase